MEIELKASKIKQEEHSKVVQSMKEDIEEKKKQIEQLA
jgi:hypothetical protein